MQLYLTLAVFASLTLVGAAAPNIKALRTVMTDSRFVGLVSPCATGGSSRNTAAEWLRTAFHDAGSHDAASGTGGLDGSIAFEMGFSENTGSFVSATLNQFRLFQQDGVSLADLIALGAITAVGACGGPLIPFRAGRIDAKGPVVEGFLPLPEQSTTTHSQQFARMGFSQQEMISLVACGHTIGGVHRVNNPQITSANHAGFDSTRTNFDNLVAREYTNGSFVNPLAQPINSDNLATSSDSRLFSSDGNITLSRYAASQDAFFADCNTVFSRMLNDAIPSGQSLTAPIEPYPVTVGFRTSLRSGVYHLQTASARVYNVPYTSFDIVYLNRDGSVGTDTNLIFPRNVRTLSNGAPISIRDFSTRSPGVNPTTGISAIKVALRLADGSLYSSPEGTETEAIDDTIMIDTGDAFTCLYTSPTGTVGLNVTVQVLGPYNAADRVELFYDLASDLTKTTYGTPIKASYRSARDGTPFIYYNVFVPNVAAANVGNFAARINRADGSVHTDDRQGIYYVQAQLGACLAGATIPVEGPTPSAGSTADRAAIVTRRRTDACAARGLGWKQCGAFCLDTLTSLESCGGCPGDEYAVDCTTIESGNDVMQCIKGRCVASASTWSTDPKSTLLRQVRSRFGSKLQRR